MAGGADFRQAANDLRNMAGSFALATGSATALGKALNDFRQFESQLVLTNAIAGGTVQTLERMKTAAREFSLVTTTSALDAGRALQSLAQAGFTAQQSLSAMNGVLLLAQATLSDVSQTSDVISSNIRAFGLAASETSRVANVFTASITGSLATMDKLAFAFRQVAPVAELANLSIEETTAALAVLFNVGLRGEQAGTALRNIIIRLVRPLGEAGDLLREARIATRDATGEFRNLADILTDIANSDLGNADLARIFETEALAGVRAIITALEDVDEAGNSVYDNLLTNVTNTNRALELAAANLDTFDGSMKLLRNTINDVGKDVGEQLAEPLKDLSFFVRESVAAFRAMDEELQQQYTNWLLIAAAVTSVLAILGGFAAVLRTLGLIQLAVISAKGAFALLEVTSALVLRNFLGLTLSAGQLAAGFVGIAGAVGGATYAFLEFTDIGNDLRDNVLRPMLEVLGVVRSLEDIEIENLQFERGQTNARETINSILGEGFLAQLESDVNAARNQLSLLSVGDFDTARASNQISVRQTGRVADVEAEIQEAREAFGAQYADAREFLIERERLFAELQELLEDPNLSDRDRARAERRYGDAVAELISELTVEEQSAALEYQNALKELQQQLDGANANVEEAFRLEKGAIEELLQSIVNGTAELGDDLQGAVTLISGSGVFDSRERVEALAAALASGDEENTIKDVLRAALEDAGFSDEEIIDALTVEEQRRNSALLRGLEGINTELEADLREIRISRREAELDRAETIADAIRLGNEAGILALEAELDDVASSQQSLFDEVLTDFGIDLTQGVQEALAAGLDAAGIDYASDLPPAFSDVISGVALTDAINAQIDESTTLEEARSIIEREAAKYQEIFEVYIESLIESVELSPEQVAALRKAFESSTEVIGATALEGVESGVDARERAQERVQRAAEKAERDAQKAIRDAERLRDQEIRAAEDAVRDARELQDIYRDFADVSIDARETYFNSLRGVGMGVREDITQSFDLEQINRKFNDQIVELTRTFEDLQMTYRDRPDELAKIGTEYDILISQIERARDAEIEATDSWTAQMERRSEALKLFQRDLQDVAAESQQTFTKVAAGIVSSFAEYQESLIGIIDITRDATTGFLDALSTGVGDFIFDSENALENFKNTILDISRDIVEGFTKAFLQQAISDLTGGEGSILGNAQQPSPFGRTGTPGIGDGGILGGIPFFQQLFGGMSANDENAQSVASDPNNSLQRAMEEAADNTAAVFDRALVDIQATLARFNGGLNASISTSGSAVPGAPVVFGATDNQQLISANSVDGGLAAAVANAGATMATGAFDSLEQGIIETAAALQIDPIDLATVISYETAGTFDPRQPGPTTQHGQHRGLIQFGEPQAAQYGVDFSSQQSALQSQLGADGAIVKYLLGSGFQPGMGILDLYSTINAGAPGLHNRSDANNGGAPGTVLDKVNNQMAGHIRNAEQLFAEFSSNLESVVADTGEVVQEAGQVAAQAQAQPQSMPIAAGAGLGGVGSFLQIPQNPPSLGEAFGSAIGNAFSLNNILGFASQFFADGGMVSGPGTGTSDSIMAMVSNGEFIVKAKQAQQYGALLQAINDDRLPAFADGGFVGSPTFDRPSSGGSGGDTNIYDQRGGDVVSLNVRYNIGGGSSRSDLTNFRRSAAQHSKQLMKQMEKARRKNT